MPILEEHDQERRVGILLVTGDRGLAGPFNSQIIRAGNRRRAELEAEGKEVVWYASGRRGVSSLNFRGFDVAGSYIGFTDRPAYANAREIGDDLVTAYVDGELDRVELIFNHYVSPLTQEVRVNTLLPLQQMAALVAEAEEEGGDEKDDSDEERDKASWLYEPEP